MAKGHSVFVIERRMKEVSLSWVVMEYGHQEKCMILKRRHGSILTKCMRGFQGFIDWEEKAQMLLNEIKKKISE